VVDVADPLFTEKMAVVERLLGELELAELPRLTLFNKIDLLSEEEQLQVARHHGKDGFMVSAVNVESLFGFLEHAERAIGRTLQLSRS